LLEAHEQHSSQAQAHIEELQLKLSEVQQQSIDVQMIAEAHKQVQQELEDSQSALASEIKAKDKAIGQIEAQQQEIATLQTTLTRAQDEIARLEEGSTMQHDQVERSQSKVVQLETGQDRLLSDLHALEEQLDEKDAQLQQLVSDMHAEREEADAKLEEVLQEAESLKQDLLDLQDAPQDCAQCASRESDASELQKENECLGKIIAKLRFEASDREGEHPGTDLTAVKLIIR